eukprot:2852447-Prymnesium_polylepis.1
MRHARVCDVSYAEATQKLEEMGLQRWRGCMCGPSHRRADGMAVRIGIVCTCSPSGAITNTCQSTYLVLKTHEHAHVCVSHVLKQNLYLSVQLKAESYM